jgi:hypothetical protein
MVENFKTEGDALSRLIQLQAARYDIRLAWSGKGIDDLASLLNAHAVKARISKHLWTGIQDLMRMPELMTLPEPLQAQIMSIVLKSQALTDLETEDHARRLSAAPKTKGAA